MCEHEEDLCIITCDITCPADLSMSPSESASWRDPKLIALPRPLRPGDVLCVQGMGAPATLNLQKGTSLASGVLLHLNPRRGQACVVRNSYERGSWAQEEVKGGWPFREAGRPWMYKIAVTESGVQITVEGVWFADFAFRENGCAGDVHFLDVQAYHRCHIGRARAVVLTLNPQLAAVAAAVANAEPARPPNGCTAAVPRYPGGGAPSSTPMVGTSRAPVEAAAAKVAPDHEAEAAVDMMCADGQGSYVADGAHTIGRWAEVACPPPPSAPSPGPVDSSPGRAAAAAAAATADDVLAALLDAARVDPRWLRAFRDEELTVELLAATPRVHLHGSLAEMGLDVHEIARLEVALHHREDALVVEDNRATLTDDGCPFCHTLPPDVLVHIFSLVGAEWPDRPDSPEHLRAGLALPAVCRLWRRVTSEQDEGGFWQSMLQARWPPATSLLCSPKDVVLLSPGAIDSAQRPPVAARRPATRAAAAAAAEAPAAAARSCACAPQRVRWATLAAAAKARAGAARGRPTGPGARPSSVVRGLSRGVLPCPPDDLPAAARRGLDVVRAELLAPVAPVDGGWPPRASSRDALRWTAEAAAFAGAEWPGRHRSVRVARRGAGAADAGRDRRGARGGGGAARAARARLPQPAAAAGQRRAPANGGARPAGRQPLSQRARQLRDVHVPRAGRQVRRRELQRARRRGPRRVRRA